MKRKVEEGHVEVECQQVLKVFPGVNNASIIAVNKVDLSIRHGEFVIIAGRSGSGKSTLLGLIGGLDRPTSGAVRIRGKTLETIPDKELARFRRENIGFIFQDFNLLPAYTGFENIDIALAPASLSKNERHARVESLLRKFDVLKRSGNRPAEMSLGERQRVAIARALANEPMLILADEPTGSVDPVTGKEVVDTLLMLNRDKGVTVVVATHGTFPQKVGSRVLFIKDGSLVSREIAGPLEV